MITETHQIELRHLRYFLAVAEELHFRRAAERLFISQPGLSRQIAQLESLLGVTLLSRDKKRVSLTPAGEFLKAECEQLLIQLERSYQQAALIAEGRSGEIRVGFLGSAMQQVVPELLLGLKAQFPDIKTSLEELSNQAQVAAIQKEQLDIGFVRLQSVPQGLELRAVHQDTFSLVLPKEHPLLGNDSIRIKDFEKEDFILFAQDYSRYYYDTVMSICEQAGFQPRVSHRSVHAQTIFKLVENGLGISIVPTSLQQGFDMGVRFVELRDIPQRAVLSVVWKKAHRNPVLDHCLSLLNNL